MMSAQGLPLGRIVATALTIAGLIGCGGGSTSPTGTPGPTTPGQSGASTPILPPDATPTATPGSGAFTPGSVRYRFVHAYAPADGSSADVDVVMRTQGLVQAQLVTGGVGLGTVTDYFAPPEPGEVVLARAGAPDVTCVIDCADFYYTASTNSGEGDQRTLLLYGEEDRFSSGTGLADVTEVLDLWEHPDPASVGSFSNAIRPADPAAARLFVIGAAVPEADFGLRMAVPGTDGCQAPVDGASVLIGGNQIVAFDVEPGSQMTIHGTTDPDCSGEPVGGPFEADVAMGGRSYLILYGGLGSMEALSVTIP